MATLRLRDDIGLRVHYADHTRFGSAVTGLIDRLITGACAPLLALARREGPARLVAATPSLVPQILHPQGLGALFERTDVLREDCLYPAAERVTPVRIVAYGLGAAGAGTCSIPLPRGCVGELADVIGALERGVARPRYGLGAALWDELFAAGALVGPSRGDTEGVGLADGVTCIGHATIVAQLDGVRIVVDPFAVPPNRGDPQDARPLPCRAFHPDAVCITHSHPDHYDLHALLRFGADTTIIVPVVERESLLAVDMAGRLRELGFRRVVALGWHQETRVGPFRVAALPFYGEQPTSGDFLHPEARNQGNTYLLAAKGRQIACIADAGADAAGRTVELAADSAARHGALDVLFGGYRAWRLHPLEYLGTSVARYLLQVPRQQWGERQQIMHDAEDLLDTASAWRARQVVPYANGGAPWFARLGLGPHGADNGDFDPELDTVVRARRRRPTGPELRLMRPGESMDIFV